MTEMLVQPESKVKPAEIRRAIGALWLSLALDVIVFGWHVYRGALAFSVTAQILTFVFFAFLVWKVSQGRSWARGTWLFVFVSKSLVIALLCLFYKSYPAVFVMVQTAIQFYATFLLFTSKARTWFVGKQEVAINRHITH